MSSFTLCYVITHRTKDFGDKYLVRIHRLTAGSVIPDEKSHAVCDTLEAARATLPSNLMLFPRFPEDDPVIVENWM